MKLRITSLDNKRFSMAFVINHKILNETYHSTWNTFKIKHLIMNLRIPILFYKIGGEVNKGQLISKANFLVLIWTKNRIKLFFDFFPSL